MTRLALYLSSALLAGAAGAQTAPTVLSASAAEDASFGTAVAADGEVSGASELRIDTARLAPGLYVVRAEGESFAETRRLTVVR